MASPTLAALRKWGKRHQLSYATSPMFRKAVNAVLEMQRFPQTDAQGDLELERRTTQFRQSAMLQRTLEVDFKLRHQRSLMTAAIDAADAGHISLGAGREAALSGNISRHKEWDDPKAVKVARKEPNVDPWSSGADPWSAASRSCGVVAPVTVQAPPDT